MANERTSVEPKSVASVIASDMRITGECRVEGPLRVDGTVEGSVHGAKSVVVTRTGLVRGQLESRDVVVAGTVDGTIECDGRLEFEATGRFQGELRTPALRVGDGAKLNGFLTVGSDPADRREASDAPRHSSDRDETAVRSAS